MHWSSNIDCLTVIFEIKFGHDVIMDQGVILFCRFNAMNKLPWDDINDQFVIQVFTNHDVLPSVFNTLLKVKVQQ